jgi:hypothetical protein
MILHWLRRGRHHVLIGRVSESRSQLAGTPLRTASLIAARRSPPHRAATWRSRCRCSIQQARTRRPQLGSRWCAFPSFPCGSDLQILRILAVLNEEMGRLELDYETRARLYFYLGFQRYVLLTWLNLLPARNSRTRERCCNVSAILQRLVSPSSLQCEAMDGQMYRDMLITLSCEILALLRLPLSGQR